MPSGADRQHFAVVKAQPPCEQQPLAAHHLLVMQLERRLPAEAVEQVVGVVWLAAGLV